MLDRAQPVPARRLDWRGTDLLAQAVRSTRRGVFDACALFGERTEDMFAPRATRGVRRNELVAPYIRPGRARRASVCPILAGTSAFHWRGRKRISSSA